MISQWIKKWYPLIVWLLLLALVIYGMAHTSLV